MNLPEPYASAPTPRTDVVFKSPANIAIYISNIKESHKNLERENLWLREVVAKMHKALDSDALWPISGRHVPLELTGIYASGGSLTSGPINCAESHAYIKQALSACNQLQEYLKNT